METAIWVLSLGIIFLLINHFVLLEKLSRKRKRIIHLEGKIDSLKIDLKTNEKTYQKKINLQEKCYDNIINNNQEYLNIVLKNSNINYEKFQNIRDDFFELKKEIYIDEAIQNKDQNCKILILQKDFEFYGKNYTISVCVTKKDGVVEFDYYKVTKKRIELYKIIPNGKLGNETSKLVAFYTYIDENDIDYYND